MLEPYVGGVAFKDNAMNFLNIPVEIFTQVAGNLCPQEILNLRLLCSKFSMLRTIYNIFGKRLRQRLL